MLWFKKLLLKIGFLRKGDRFDKDLSEEMRLHLELMVEENIQVGMSKTEARKAAKKKFGNLESIREDCHDSWGTQMLTGMTKEFRLGLRQLYKNKGFTVTITLTLAICLAGNVIAYTVLKSVLGPPPVPEPERLVQVYDTYSNSYGPSRHKGGMTSAAAYMEFSKHADAFESITLAEYRERNVSYNNSVTRGKGLWVIQSFFDVIGLPPILGRHFTKEDYDALPYSLEEATAGYRVILSESFWLNKFDGDRNIIGKTIYIGSIPNTVIGVVPEEVGSCFQYPEYYRAWGIADRWPEEARFSGRYALNAMIWGRLKDGVTMSRAKAQLDAINDRYHEEAPAGSREFRDRSGQETQLATLQEIYKSQVGNTLYLIQASVLMVMLIGCMNISNILVSRTLGRQLEYSVRSVLGASRLILIRQSVMECMALAFICFAVSLMIAWPALALVKNYLLVDFLPTTTFDFTLQGSSIVFLFGSSILMGLLLSAFSSVLILYFNSTPVGASQQTNSRATANKSVSWVRSFLVSGQIAVTMILLIGAGLLIQSFAKAISTDPGFQTSGVYASKIGLDWKNWNPIEKKTEFRNRFEASISEIPGVVSVAFCSALPIVDELGVASGFAISGTPETPDDELISTRMAAVSKDYFRTLEINLLRGRFFNSGDLTRRGATLIVDRDFVELYLNGIDPIGKHLGSRALFEDPSFNPESAPVIIGVVENVKHEGLDGTETSSGSKKQPMAYSLITNFNRALVYGVLIKTKRPYREVFPIVQQQLAEIDPRISLYLNTSLDTLVRGSLDGRRAFMLLVTILSLMALTLSSLGVYGLLAYDVTQRTKEIGIRMAMGATRKRVVEWVVRQSAVKVVVGLILGITGSYIFSDRISAFLFQVTPTEPAIYVGVTMFVLLIAFLATYLPARRASHIQPMDALRTE